MQNNLEIVDLPEDSIRQYIDAKSAFTALEQAKLRSAEFRGGMVWKAVKGKEYLVRTTTRGGQTGLGAKSTETEAIYDKFTAGKARAAELSSGLKQAAVKHQRLNRALRVGRTPNISIDILLGLSEAGLSDKFTIIGTNALYAYETAAGVRLNEAHLATRDVDLLWDNRKKLSLFTQENRLAGGMLGFLQGIDSSFTLRDDQLYTAVNKDGYEVDILRRMGHGSDAEPGRFSALTDDFWVVKARNADWLLSAPKFSEVVVGVNGKMARMNTVDPRAFALFKLWMSDQSDREPGKRIRDASQARIVVDLINSYLPQYSFEEIKVFPSAVTDKIAVDSAGTQRIVKSQKSN